MNWIFAVLYVMNDYLMVRGLNERLHPGSQAMPDCSRGTDNCLFTIDNGDVEMAL